mgnify:FL=1|nr:MAG TPA: Major tail protein [Bacteriophage sp.]
MASSTYQTYLMYKATTGGSATFSKLIDIITLPDLGSPPEQIDTTTLSDPMRMYIPGVEDVGSLEFEVLYDQDSFDTINKLGRETEYDFAVYVGADSDGTPDGHNGKWTFKGRIAIVKTGGGVNEYQGATVTIYPSTAITFAKGT